MAAKAQSQVLPPKEANLFKNIGRYHEKKQYRRALRCADDILAVHKNHGETMSMKGLTLNSLEKKDQAYEWAKLGLKNNISSPICWHVLGLIYRADRNYSEAKKCYLNAYRRDQKNLTLLRDLSLLQIQLRDLPGYLKTRKAMLHLKPSRHEYWYALSLAWQLLGHFDEAIDVMITFEDIVEGSQKRQAAAAGNAQSKPNFEESERKLYIIRLYQRAGRYADGLNYLQEVAPQIVDKTGVQELKAALLLQNGDLEAAQTEYLALLDINSENHNYHEGYQKSLGLYGPGLAADQVQTLTEKYEELRKKYPSCSSTKQMPLTFLPLGEEFTKQLDNYLQSALRKGVPSLWGTLENLYTSQPEKASFIGERVLGYYTSLKTTAHFPGLEDEELEEPPSTILWTMIFLAQHFDREKNYVRALELIDEAIEHTPLAIDAYMYRAKILKHAGDIQQAARQMDNCRQLDLADRYLNTITTRYLLLADCATQADSTVELFTRDADNHNVSLTEMQCVWYEQNAANHFLRTKQFGKSLKKALAIDTHFQDFTEDQFDFHSYCLRKMTLSAYTDLLRFEDRLYSHKNYFNAARTIVQNYLALHARPVHKEPTAEELFAHLTGGELRKALRKYKRDQAKKEEEAKQRKELEAKERLKQQQSQKKKTSGPIDEDPEGKQLEAAADPLAEASKFTSQLSKWCGDRIDTHLLAYDVYSRKGKWLLALRSVRRALNLAPNHPITHDIIIRLSLVSAEEIADELVRSVFVEQRNEITKGLSSKELNEEYSKQVDSLPKLFAACKAEFLLNPSSKDTIKTKVSRLDFPKLTWQEVVPVLEWIEEVYGVDDANAYRKQAAVLFPLASFFKIPEA